MRSLRYIAHRLNVWGRLREQEVRLNALEQRNLQIKELRHYQNGKRLAENDSAGKSIHFIHVFGTENAGDEFCGPEYYFQPLFRGFHQVVHEFAHIDYAAILPHDVVVFGGGGLLDYSDVWNERILRCMQLCDNVVLWGCGSNHHLDYPPVSKAIPYDKFALVGVRDYGCEQPYLPCVSCMLPPLSKQYPLLRRVGVAEHKAFPIEGLVQFDRISNGTEDIHAVLQFIGTSEIIITNTYHMWYWATLMQKKVILYGKFSTKFDALRYPPVLYSGDLEKDIARCEIHPEALKEAVGLNRAFAQQVRDLLQKE